MSTKKVQTGNAVEQGAEEYARTTTYVFPAASDCPDLGGLVEKESGAHYHKGTGTEPRLKQQQDMSSTPTGRPQHHPHYREQRQPGVSSLLGLVQAVSPNVSNAMSGVKSDGGRHGETGIGATFTTRGTQQAEIGGASSTIMTGLTTSGCQSQGNPSVTLKGIPGPPRSKPPLLKTASLGPGISAFGSEEERQKTMAKSVLQNVRHVPIPTVSLSNINKVGHQAEPNTSKITSTGGVISSPSATLQTVTMSNVMSSLTGGGSNVGGSGLKMPPKSALKGHHRSASHGGVIVPSRTIDVSSMVSGDATKPSAMRRGHTRAASHGQIVEDPSQTTLKSHSRAHSKTDFILPPGHLEKEKDRERSGSNAMIKDVYVKGHSRQASRSESIYTLRQHPINTRSKFLFWKKPKTENTRIRAIVPNHIVPAETSSDQHPNGKYCSNRICTTKYTAISFLPKNLFEQFHRFANLYFISIVLLNWIPEISAFGKEIAMLPVMFVLGVTAIKDLFEDRRRYNSDKRINNATCRVWNRESRRYTKVKWKEMRVGDIVHLSCNEAIPADILLLKTSDPNGLCYIETMNLDGESNLKQREVVRGFVEKHDEFDVSKFESTIEVENPTTKVYHFSGKMIHKNQAQAPLTKENLLLRDCYLKNTDFVEGIVIYAGQDTKAMLNNGGPRHKRTGLERLMNIEVVWCVVILAVLCIIGATGSTLWSSSYNSVPFLPPKKDSSCDGYPLLCAFLSFLTFIILLQVMIPLSLYVTIELTKLLQIYHIHNDVDLYDPDTNKRIQCRAMNITEDLGQIQYIFSDKTGTLTENKMMFRRCCISGEDFNHSQPTAAEEQRYKKSNSSPPLQVNPTLSERLYQATLKLKEEHNSMSEDHKRDIQRIYDFFIILASCNTVVVAKHPHHDNMNASGVIEGSTDQVNQYSRLSPIRESTDQSLSSSNYGSSQDHSQLLVEYQVEPDSCGIAQRQPDTQISPAPSLVGTMDPPSRSFQPELTSVKPAKSTTRRPRMLDFKGNRPLSPISSSNETTPTESPAQRPRFLNIPPILSRFNRTLQVSSPAAVTPTPSPSEIKPIYEAESPDELALVQAAYAYSCRLIKRTPQMIKIAMPGETPVEYEVLQTFPFDSVRKRMSIVLKHSVTKEIILYCKGADGAIFPRLKVDRNVAELISNTQTYINNYAREGLRVLVMAKRKLSELEYCAWLAKYRQAELDLDNRDNLMYDAWCSLEANMELVGATGVEDRLQERVPETIEALRNAGIVVWVLTGDKQETAVNIAYSCRLFTPSMDIIKLNARSKDTADKAISFYLDQAEKLNLTHQHNQGTIPDDGAKSNSNSSAVFNSQAAMSNHLGFQPSSYNGSSFMTESSQNTDSDAMVRLSTNERALVVDGRTLTYILDVKAGLITKFLRLTKHCSSVLCCRATPLQKACIVSSVKDQLGMITLAIGDGANDVSMIQRADIGIGISGKEGMQAVMASDFAISKFKFLEKLLLVHGHWCYDRLARMILYFFYKNAAFVFVIFWFQLLNGWSGSVMIDQMYLMVFNLFFTALPPMAIGVYDQDASADLLLQNPKLYRQGRLQLIHQPHTFWLNMLDALYQSIVIFFMAYGAYNGSDVGMFEFGTTITVSCMFSMLSHMAIEAKSWTMIHVLSILVSVLFFYAFAFIYNTVCINCLGFENPFWVIHEIITSPVHWLTVLISTVLAVIPRMAVRCLLTSLYPSDVTKALLMKNQRNGNPANNEEELFGSWSRSSSSSSVFKNKISFFCCRRMDHGHSSPPGVNTGENSTTGQPIPVVAT